MDSFIELFAVSPLVLVVFLSPSWPVLLTHWPGRGLTDRAGADGGRHAAGPGAGDQ
jgi:hypothetical protein